MINHRIINHIQTSNIDFDTWNDIYWTYIANIASKCEEVVFQTNFGFAGYDCPVTIYISNVVKNGDNVSLTTVADDSEWTRIKNVLRELSKAE